jgi:hypothetical protein
MLFAQDSKATIYPKVSIYSKKGGGSSRPMDVIYYRLYYECPKSEGDVSPPGLTPLLRLAYSIPQVIFPKQYVIVLFLIV